MIEEGYLRETYDFVCPGCKKQLWAAPSMSMQMGMNSGHGTCPRCKMFFHLEIVPDLDGDIMEAEDWQKYMKRRKAPDEEACAS